MTMKKQAVPTTPSDQLKVRAMQQALSWFPLAALAAGGARGGMGLINSAVNSAGPPIKVPQRQTVLSIPYRIEDDENKKQVKIAADPGLFEDWAHKLTNLVGITQGKATPTTRPPGVAFLAGDNATTGTDLPWKQPLSVAAGALGGIAGYYGVDALMDARRKARLKTDLTEAERDYNAALTGSRKTATDAAFDALYDAVEKKALLGNLAGQYLTAMMVAGAVPGVAMYNYTRANSKGKILEEAARRRQQQLFMQTQLPPVAKVVPYRDNEKKAADIKPPAAPALDAVLDRYKSTVGKLNAGRSGASSALQGLVGNEKQWQDTMTSLGAPRSSLSPRFNVAGDGDKLKYIPPETPAAPATFGRRSPLAAGATTAETANRPLPELPNGDATAGLPMSPDSPGAAVDRPTGLPPLELSRPPTKPADVTTPMPIGLGGLLPGLQSPTDLIGTPGESHPGPTQSQLSPPATPAAASASPAVSATQPGTEWYQNPYILGGGALAGGGLLAYLMSRQQKKRRQDEEYA